MEYLFPSNVFTDKTLSQPLHPTYLRHRVVEKRKTGRASRTSRLKLVWKPRSMDNMYSEDGEQVHVVGFEVPRSPDSSYNNPFPAVEDEARDPPSVPSHLQHTLLSCPTSLDASGSLPAPQSVVLNHLYIENRETPTPRSVIALGITHRFRAKYVTVVLYKPIQRRGS